MSSEPWNTSYMIAKRFRVDIAGFSHLTTSFHSLHTTKYNLLPIIICQVKIHYRTLEYCKISQHLTFKKPAQHFSYKNLKYSEVVVRDLVFS